MAQLNDTLQQIFVLNNGLENPSGKPILLCILSSKIDVLDTLWLLSRQQTVCLFKIVFLIHIA